MPERILDRLRNPAGIWQGTSGETFFTQNGIAEAFKNILLGMLKKVDELRPGIIIGKPLPIPQFYKYTYTGVTDNLGVTEY